MLIVRETKGLPNSKLESRYVVQHPENYNSQIVGQRASHSTKTIFVFTIVLFSIKRRKKRMSVKGNLVRVNKDLQDFSNFRT